MATGNNGINKSSFVLRRVFGPYAFWPFIIVVITVIWLPYILRTHDWSPLEALAVGVVLFVVPIVWFSFRYRIYWQDGDIVTKGGGPFGGTRTISVKDVTHIRQEVSDLHTLVKASRPSKRISIYAQTPEGMTFTDVSLKHFNLDDVRTLMRMIHERRPDLKMPKGWS